MYTARPRDNDVPADRVVEWRDDDVRIVGRGGTDRRVEVGHEIARSLTAEGIRDRRCEPENRKRSDWSENKLERCFTGRRCHAEGRRLRPGAAKGSHQT